MEEHRKRFFVMIRLFLIILLALWLLVFIVHKAMTASELKKMKADGFYNPINTGDYDINVYVYGNENGKHTIVGMSGQGVNTYSLGIKAVTDQFSYDNRIAIVDRAGYGLSDSTNIPQTLDQVVNDYRTALKKAGCNGPYILLPHSMGGLYATYWQSLYPEEIEAMLILEGVCVGTDGMPGYETYPSSIHEMFLTTLCNTGLQRIFHNAMKGEMSWRNLTLLHQKYANAMEMHSTYTYAQHSESQLFNENCREAWKTLKKTNIPKIYITCQPANEKEVREYLEYRNETYTSLGKDPPYDLNDTVMITKKTDGFMNAVMEQNVAVSAYADAVGNCAIVHVPGIHNIYKQKPAEIADILAQLIDLIEK